MLWNVPQRLKCQSGRNIKIFSKDLTQTLPDISLTSWNSLHFFYKSWQGANGAMLHNNTALCTFSMRLKEHNIHPCWQLNNRCYPPPTPHNKKKKVIFLQNSIILWTTNWEFEENRLHCLDVIQGIWTWVTRGYRFSDIVFVKTARFMGYGSRS